MPNHTVAAIALAALALLTSPSAQATTVMFSYDGIGDDTPDITSHGTGSLSFTGSGAITRADLTGFSFSQTTTLADPSLMGTGTFTYGLGDLTSFTGLFVDGAFSNLSLATRTVADPSGFLADQSFRISFRQGSSGDTAETRFDDGDTATAGKIGFAAAVPEPGSWATMLAGMGAVGGALRRRRAFPACGRSSLLR